MENIDLNLLPGLDALLTECSVTAAARRLGLSASAMSRTLTRLRSATGDPLLVRAGRGLVPTPRAIELQAQVHELARDVRSVLSPRAVQLDVASLDRTFTIRANDGFIDIFSARLMAAITAEAPLVSLRFVPKPTKDSLPLREGVVDLEIGVLGAFAPEVRTLTLFHDHFVGAVRMGHPLLKGRITPKRFAACKHVVVSRKANYRGPVDDALESLGLVRHIVAIVPGFPAAVRIASQSDLVALVPRSSLDGRVADGIVSFELPLPTPEVTISAMWHPRMQADPAHRWLRDTLIALCRSARRPRR